MATKLTERDVPGAKFHHAEVESHSNTQIKRWLQCRGLKVNGLRQDLINRAKICISAGKDKEIDVSIDQGKWLERKIRQSLESSTSTSIKTSLPILPVTGWKPFSSSPIPSSFNYGHVHHYMIESVVNFANDSDSDGESMDIHTSKPLRRGKIFFTSGHVKDIQDSTKHTYYFIKAKIMASFKLGVVYNCSCTLSQNSGFVIGATCDCKASTLGRCSHVCALLLALLDFTNKSTENEGQSCTSLPCLWNKGRLSKKHPKRIFQASYGSYKERTVDRIMKFDPRPPSLQHTTSSETSSFKKNLQAHSSSTSTAPSMWETLLQFHYDDYSLASSDQALLKSKCEKLICNLSVGNPNTKFYVQLLESQCTERWHLERRVCITASDCKRVAGLTSTASLKSYLNSHLWERQELRNNAIMYGKSHESAAREDYAKLLNVNGGSVLETGFWINPKFPELACSPDGLVKDPIMGQDMYGLVEIKCPKILENQAIAPDTINSLKACQKRNFSLFIDNGELKLKPHHSHYYQVQMQLAVAGLKWCDYFVWSIKGHYVERITFDEVSWKTLKCKLVSFHHNVLCPEYFEMRVPRDLLPFDLRKINFL